MAEPLDPQVVLFAPVKGVRVEDDGTITPVGIFTRLTSLDPGDTVRIDFTVLALLIGGLGVVEATIHLVDPDGGLTYAESRTIEFLERHRLFGIQWNVVGRALPGEYELRLLVDGVGPVVALPFVLSRAEEA